MINGAAINETAINDVAALPVYPEETEPSTFTTSTLWFTAELPEYD